VERLVGDAVGLIDGGLFDDGLKVGRTVGFGLVVGVFDGFQVGRIVFVG